MFEGETDLVCRYHKDCPEGKVFLRKDAEMLEGGWVDSPIKLGKIPVAEKVVKTVVPAKIEPEPTKKEDTVAEKLLKGEGLNFSSFIRAHGKNHKDQRIKKELRPYYDAILKDYEGKIYKQGHDWFLKDK